MLKRLFDITVASSGLILLLPIFGLISIKVKKNLGSPILFRQIRPGLNERLFEMLKFRSMLNAVDGNGNVLPDEKRITNFGRWLRSTSLDELPELWNVIKGDMSLVGPRPLLEEYLPLYNAYQVKRHNVRPGITGWAQINGRNNLTWDEKFKLDVWYVENQSLWLDIRILILTIRKVFQQADISASGHVTNEKFKGNSN